MSWEGQNLGLYHHKSFPLACVLRRAGGTMSEVWIGGGMFHSRHPHCRISLFLDEVASITLLPTAPEGCRRVEEGAEPQGALPHLCVPTGSCSVLGMLPPAPSSCRILGTGSSLEALLVNAWCIGRAGEGREAAQSTGNEPHCRHQTPLA